MQIDTEQMINAVNAADIKGFESVDAFMYHVKTKPETTPQPILIDGIRFWNKSELEAWVPTLSKRGRKTTNQGE